jgi:F-type H+-transporting ATPase subunit gamma
MVAAHKKLLRRIKAIQRTQEITKAIRFITGGEIAKIRKDVNRRFTALCSFIPLFTTKYLKAQANEQSELDFSYEGDDADSDGKGVLVIPICDDRTSCGPHNINVMAKAAYVINRLKRMNQKVRVYPIGLQGQYFCEDFYDREMIAYTKNLIDVNFSLDICFFFVKKFISYGFDKYYLIFNRFFTLQFQYTIIYRLSNYKDFVRNLLRNIFTKYSIYYNAVLDKAVFNGFLEDLYIFGFSMFLLDAFNDNKYSFLGARFTAMDEMINNSQEYLDRLTIKYNKLRQESITTEIVEIIACKESIVEE